MTLPQWLKVISAIKINNCVEKDDWTSIFINIPKRGLLREAFPMDLNKIKSI